MTFLQKTAQHLISTYGAEISNICVVLPNKRAGLFLKKHLSQLIDQPIWIPPIIGAEDLVEELSDKEIIDNLTQLFELYQVYLKLTKTPESFEEFSKWGQMLLHDFNEIDRYLIPSEKLYAYINEARAIEVWNLGEGEVTDFQAKYLAFWEQMGQLYTNFKQHLEKNNKAYQGAAFRLVVEQIQESPLTFIQERITWKKIVFAGFNALTAAEETLIALLIKEGKAEVLWDADEYYLEDEYQESGMFLRRFKSKPIFDPFNWVSNKFKTENKNINILGIPQNIGQAKYLTNIFNELESNNYEDTAIVLADENLLIPVLQSIPEEIQNINVTMGYPLKNTPLNNFFEIFFTTILNAERFGKKDKLTYHYKDVLKLTQLSFCQLIFGTENCNTIKKQIVSRNWVFINNEKLDFINQQVAVPFKNSYSVDDLLNTCLSFIELGKQYYTSKQTESKNLLELEYLFLFSKLINQLKVLTDKYKFIKNIKSFYSIYKQLQNSFDIELYGEPLKGLQVMGMLETRNIDFKNVILLSTNEGILPSGKTFNSFVPFDIKKEYKLPTHIEKDAIYAYHFYRLVQNAENMFIIYNTESGNFNTGEQSRFITQVENELSDFKNVNITKKIITYPTIQRKGEPVKVEKTPLILEKIHQLFENGISPTALNTYVNCPLDFYYKYIIGVREADDVEETIDHSSFGTYLHEILEILYQPFNHQKKNITITDIEQMLKKSPDVALQVFSKRMTERELKSGKNLISFSVAQNYVTTFLKNEMRFLKQTEQDVFINQLEGELKGKLELNNVTIHLKGKADRIDSYGNTLRIIDYKTGKVETKDLKIKSLDELRTNAKKSKALQILMYAYLYAQQNDINTTSLKSGVISFRTLSNGFMPFELDKNEEITQELLTNFNIILREVFDELLNAEIPFAHSLGAQYCEFCEN